MAASYARDDARGRGGRPGRLAGPATPTVPWGAALAPESGDVEGFRWFPRTCTVERAAALLRSTDWSVADVCFRVGLRSVGSFTTSFRRVYGVSPTVYRAAHPPLERARIPTCVLQAYARPHRSSFREDASAA